MLFCRKAMKSSGKRLIRSVVHEVQFRGDVQYE